MFDTAMSQIEKQKSKPKLPGSSEEQFYKDWLELLRQAVQIATARIAVFAGWHYGAAGPLSGRALQMAHQVCRQYAGKTAPQSSAAHFGDGPHQSL